MINAAIALSALLIVPDAKSVLDVPPTFQSIAEAEFLAADQVRTLIVGRSVSHRPPRARSNVSMTFKANGRVNFINPKGMKGTGSWELRPSGVLCLLNVGGAGTKTFCSYLTRKGNKVYHYHPKTHERLDSNPWILKR